MILDARPWFFFSSSHFQAVYLSKLILSFASNTFVMYSYCKRLGPALDNTVHCIT